MKLLLFVLALIAVNTYAAKNIMPWICEERCGETSLDIIDDVRQLVANKNTIKVVSYELYNLAEGCKLELNKFFPVHEMLAYEGFETYAMISSYPYPPEFIEWMRQCFANPEPFFAEAIAAAKEVGFTGYNVDFEPHVQGSVEDARNYAIFLDKFAKALHKEGLKISVDVAAWNSIWDYKLIGETDVDKVYTMATYTGNLTLWKRAFLKAVDDIPLEKLGIGLQTENPSTKKPLTNAELKFRFDHIMEYGIQDIGIWRSPLPENWFPFLKRFASMENQSNETKQVRNS